MTRKLSAALVVALVLVMALSVAVFAQDAPIAPQDGTGNRFGQSGASPAGVGRVGDGSGQGLNFADVDGDGACDNFIDEDGDGVCDGQGGPMMGQRSNRGQTENAAGTAMRQGRRNGGRGGNGQQGAGQHSSGRNGGRGGNR